MDVCDVEIGWFVYAEGALVALIATEFRFLLRVEMLATDVVEF
jgi:hypothetical protein